MRIQRLRRIFSAAVLTAYFVLSAGHGKASALSASAWFETDLEEVHAGDQVQISLNISTDTTLGGFEGFISYNNAVLAYVGGPACISEEDGLLHVNDLEASASWDTRQYIMTFQALQQGTGLIQLIYQTAAYDYETKEMLSVSSSACQLTIEAADASVPDARLAMLRINPGILTPSFAGDIVEYSTFVDAGTEKLTIGAVPVDPLSTVKVTGNASLREGDNTITIVVTTPSGEEASYTIYAFREKAAPLPEETSPAATPQQEAEADAGWFRFEVSQEGDAVFVKGQYIYKVREKTADIVLPEGYYRRRMRINQIPMTVYAQEGEELPEFFLLVLENEAGAVSLYRYDRIEKTIQRYGGQTAGAEDGKLEEQALYQNAVDLLEYKNKLSSLSLITGFSSAVSLLLLFLSIVLIVKLLKRRREEE